MSLWVFRIDKSASAERSLACAERMVMSGDGRVEVVTVRFTKRIRELVRQVAQAKGVDESDVIREAVHRQLASLSFLTDNEKKALGVANFNKTEE